MKWNGNVISIPYLLYIQCHITVLHDFFAPRRPSLMCILATFLSISLNMSLLYTSEMKIQCILATFQTEMMKSISAYLAIGKRHLIKMGQISLPCNLFNVIRRCFPDRERIFFALYLDRKPVRLTNIFTSLIFAPLLTRF